MVLAILVIQGMPVTGVAAEVEAVLAQDWLCNALVLLMLLQVALGVMAEAPLLTEHVEALLIIPKILLAEMETLVVTVILALLDQQETLELLEMLLLVYVKHFLVVVVATVEPLVTVVLGGLAAVVVVAVTIILPPAYLTHFVRQNLATLGPLVQGAEGLVEKEIPHTRQRNLLM